MKSPGIQIKVVIADDHEIFRDGLKLMVSHLDNIILVGEAENGRELVALVEKEQPDVVITDIKMPLMDGIEATRYLTQQYPTIGVIALSMFDEEQLVIEMLEAGALGYLLKNSDKSELIEAINAVFMNDHYYCKRTTGRLAQMIARSKNLKQAKTSEPEFSEREKEIIQLICQEYTNKQIGEKLFISTRTVEGYRMKILEKMNAKNTVGIVIAAMKQGIYTPDAVS